MPQYKLIYFPVRGRGELIRLIFHASGTSFEDKRIESKDWPDLKPKIPHGTLPALEVDKVLHGQSIAIARYLAKETGLAGTTNMENFLMDQLVDTVGDFAQALVKMHFEKDEAKKADLLKDFKENIVPKYLDTLKKKLQSNEYFVGKKLSWADLAIFGSLDTLTTHNPGVLDSFPELKKFKTRIEDHPKLKAYIKSRPASDI